MEMMLVDFLIDCGRDVFMLGTAHVLVGDTRSDTLMDSGVVMAGLATGSFVLAHLPTDIGSTAVGELTGSH